MKQDSESAFKAKIRLLAKEQDRDPADIWQTLVLERFLVRLARSQYTECFVLKGGVLLSKYISIGRETIDLDFLAKQIESSRFTMQQIFEEIAAIDLYDGFCFEKVQAADLQHPHMGYPGIAISMIAYFGRVRFKVHVDIGFGDVVDSIPLSISLTSSTQGSLFEDQVTLNCYPKEFIFAEKLEAHLIVV